MSSGMFSMENPITVEEALRLHPMALAFVGDGVQALFVRGRVTIGSTSKTGILHKKVIKSVSAVAQAKSAEALMPTFCENEAEVFRRARNCEIQTSAKHAEMAEYRKASGLEAVFGFLYLTGNTKRLSELLNASFSE